MIRTFIISLCIAVLQLTQANGTSVDPFDLDINSAAGTPAQLAVKNDSPRQAAFEIEMLRVEIDEAGQVTRTPAKDFTVFPPQRLIDPHTSQLFRLQWLGGPLAKSQTYLAHVKQLPVKMPKEASGMQMVTNLEVLVQVGPPSGTHTLDLVSANIATVREADKQHRVPALVVSNAGNVNSILSDALIIFRDGNWSKTLTTADLKQKLGFGVVPPGKRRKFLIPLELPESVTKLNVEIGYNKSMR